MEIPDDIGSLGRYGHEWAYVCVCESVFVSVSVSVIVIVSVSVGIEMGCNASSLRQQYIDGTHTYVTI